VLKRLLIVGSGFAVVAAAAVGTLMMRDGGDGDASGGAAAAGAICGVWERVQSSNPALDGMRVRAQGTEAVVTQAAAQRTFGVGDLLWRSVTEGEGAYSLEVLGSNGSYYSGTLTPAGDRAMNLEIAVAGSGNTQRWQQASTAGCGDDGTLDAMCGVTEALAESGTYECEGDTLTIVSAEGVVAVWTRIG
jgi:hypothetical protein